MAQTTLTMTRGDTPQWALAVVDADGAPFDLTGYTLYFTAKVALSDADPGVFQLTSGAGITVTNAAGGLATIQPRRADTSGLTDDARLFYDVQLSQAGAPDQTFTVDRGTLIITRDVTRAP
jgi:hypothetical protein